MKQERVKAMYRGGANGRLHPRKTFKYLADKPNGAEDEEVRKKIEELLGVERHMTGSDLPAGTQRFLAEPDEEDEEEEGNPLKWHFLS